MKESVCVCLSSCCRGGEMFTSSFEDVELVGFIFFAIAHTHIHIHEKDTTNSASLIVCNCF